MYWWERQVGIEGGTISLVFSSFTFIYFVPLSTPVPFPSLIFTSAATTRQTFDVLTEEIKVCKGKIRNDCTK
jgi:hypothetical protein